MIKKNLLQFVGLLAITVAILLSLITVKSVGASAAVANAGANLTVYVGEAVRLDGSSSSGYLDGSQTNGSWSVKWSTGDGYE